MTRGDAIALIREQLGFRSDQEDAIVRRLQQAQRLLEQGRSLPYFLKQEDATLSVTAGTGEIALPTGFLREVQTETFHFTDSTTDEVTWLEKLTVQESVTRFVDTDPGPPLAYSLRKATFAFYPERDIAYSLTYSYYKAADVLTSDAANSWLTYCPDVLIGAAGIPMAKALKNDYAAEFFTQIYTTAWKAIFADGILRDEEGDPLYIGGNL